MAQSVKHPTLAQVMKLWFMGLSPMWGSPLSAQSLLQSCWLPLSFSGPPSRCTCTSFPSLSLSFSLSKINKHLWGIWMGQLVEHLTLAQVMISRFTSSNPTSGLLLSVRSLFWILCPLSPWPSLAGALYLKMNIKK